MGAAKTGEHNTFMLERVMSLRLIADIQAVHLLFVMSHLCCKKTPRLGSSCPIGCVDRALHPITQEVLPMSEKP